MVIELIDQTVDLSNSFICDEYFGVKINPLMIKVSGRESAGQVLKLLEQTFSLSKI
jgi:hypothetical protein